MHRFRQHSRSRSSRSRRHYVFSGQRHFTSTIFADQILIVGWRLSKEAWSPGWFTFSHAMHERTGFLPLISLLLFSRFFLLPLRVLCAAKECDAPRHSRVPSHLQPAQRCPRNAYANRIQLPEPQVIVGTEEIGLSPSLRHVQNT